MKIKSSVLLLMSVVLLKRLPKDRNVAEPGNLVGGVGLGGLQRCRPARRFGRRRPDTCVWISRVSIDGTLPPVALVTCWPTVSSLTSMIHDHPVIRGDQRRHLEREHRVLELRRGRAARGRFLIRNFDTLHDGRLFLVRGDDARRGDRFALALVFRRRQREIHQVAATQQAKCRCCRWYSPPVYSPCSGSRAPARRPA